MSKILIGISVVLLALSAVFGVLNISKTKALRADVVRSEAARADAERLRIARDGEIKKKDAAKAAKVSEDQSKVASAEADLVKSQTEKQELEAKLHANETEIAALKQKIETAVGPVVMPGEPAAPGTAELQTALADTKKQLEAAEREKSLLSDKIKEAQERTAQLETERKRRASLAGNPGVRGTILAVNQAYNFVVLSLGGRQGVEMNAEMLVLRGGSLIGKIRVSSVEPATAIGDIITSSLGRGVQVQPGDTVVYAGTNS